DHGSDRIVRSAPGMTVSTDIVSSRTLLPESKKSYAKIAHVLDIPHLISMQLNSFNWFTGMNQAALGDSLSGLKELLEEISPIEDFTGTRMELRFGQYSFG